MALTDQNLTLVTTGKNDLLFEDREIPTPGKDEVQIAMKRVGICGTDIHFKKHGEIGDYVVKGSLIPGHECSGVVSAIGTDVKYLKVGDRVALESLVACRKCKFCKKGRYNLCPTLTILSNSCDGTLRRYHCHAADSCYKLPENVSLDEGAMMEPLSCAIHACRRAGLTLGDNVLVLGAGTIGLLCLLTSKAMGAGEVAITDIEDERLAVASKLGASASIKIDEKDPQKMAEKIHATLGWKPDITIECSGAESSFQMGVYVTENGGVLQIIGFGKPIMSFPHFDSLAREIDVRSILGYANTYPTAISMIANGLVDVKPLITHRFPLKESVEAFDVAETGRDNAIKVMIHCDE